MITLNFLDENKKIDVESSIDIELYITSDINKITKPQFTIFIINSSEDILELQARKLTPFYLLNKFKLEKYLNKIDVFKDIIENKLKEKYVELEKITVTKREIEAETSNFKPLEIKEVLDVKLNDKKVITTKRDLIDDKNVVQIQENIRLPPSSYILFKKSASKLKDSLLSASHLYYENKSKSSVSVIENVKITKPKPEPEIEIEPIKDKEELLEEEHIINFEYNIFEVFNFNFENIFIILKSISINIIEREIAEIEKKNIYIGMKKQESSTERILLSKRLGALSIALSELLYQKYKKSNVILDKNKIIMRQFNILDNIYLLKSTYYTIDENKIDKNKFNFIIYIEESEDVDIVVDKKKLFCNEKEFIINDEYGITYPFAYLYDERAIEVIYNIIESLL